MWVNRWLSSALVSAWATSCSWMFSRVSPKEKALDMLQAAAILGMDSKITGTHYYSETAGSDVIVMTAGISRRPGMNRGDLFYRNLEIVEDCVGHVSSGSPNAKVVVVTNPLNAMCEVARRASGFPSERVLGMAGILYEARMRRFHCTGVGRRRGRSISLRTWWPGGPYGALASLFDRGGTGHH